MPKFQVKIQQEVEIDFIVEGNDIKKMLHNMLRLHPDLAAVDFGLEEIKAYFNSQSGNTYLITELSEGTIPNEGLLTHSKNYKIIKVENYEN